MADSAVETLRVRAVALGERGGPSAERELEELLKSPFPAVRRAAASALGKLIVRSPDLKQLLVVPLTMAIEKEEKPQALQYMLKTLRLCAADLSILQLDVLRDVVRNPNHPDYVRNAANETIAAAEDAEVKRKARFKHWCVRCRQNISEEESRRGIDKYGKPYCHHCIEEKMHEDAVFERDVEGAKRLRTVDEVAVQSYGEKRIGDWLSARGISYRYDERVMIAGGDRIRPDFYLPEYDLYIEYWGMDTPEYMQSRRMKMVLYQRERKKLISISYHDFDRLEDVLAEKLSHHIRNIEADS